MSQDIVLTGIANFPQVFEAQQINGKGEPKYSVTLILNDPKTDWNAVQASINEAIASKFGNQVPANLILPFKKCDVSGFEQFYEIHAYGYQNRPPQVVDQNVNPVMDRSLVFSGIKVALYVRFRGYPSSGSGPGIGVDFYAMQILDNVNVKRLDNAKDAKDVFQPVPGAPPQLAPTAFSGGQQPLSAGSMWNQSVGPVNTGPGASTPFPVGAPGAQPAGPFGQGQNVAIGPDATVAPQQSAPSSPGPFPWQQ